MERKNVVEAITDVNKDARNRRVARKETENSDTQIHQTPQHTGNSCVKIRSFRAAVVCLVLLCVLLLTVVIVLGVNLHNMIEEFYIKNKNLTDEIEGLKNLNSRLDKIIKELSDTNKNLTDQKKYWEKKIDGLWKLDGWKCYQSSLYYVSSEKKNWTESRRYCTERTADLIIINNKQEQDFVKTKMVPGDSKVWIGLNDSDAEGTWKWVDGSALSPGFWASGKPSDSSGNKDCAVNLPSGFADYSCDEPINWICEKNNFNN